jgi:predicted methyltransferase
LTEAQRIVSEVAAAVGLAEGERGVQSVLATLARAEPVSIRRISRAVELPVPIVASVCGELRKRRVVALERPAQLTPHGRRLFATGGLALHRSATCSRCAGRGVVTLDELGGVAADLARAARGAPEPRVELDQCHCTVETKLRRVLALHEADALAGRRVLLLGDDDLTALAIDAVVRRFGSDASIASLAVVDVDPRVVVYVQHGLAGAPFPVACLRHDVRDPLPEALRDGFDTVLTDPPYTVPAARAFLARAAEALDGGSGDVFLSFGSRRPGAALALQRAIVDMGFVIRRLVRDFNEYVGAGALGGTSHLYHLSGAPALRSTVAERFAGPLYTAEVGA